jgi:hypothetical protein
MTAHGPASVTKELNNWIDKSRFHPERVLFRAFRISTAKSTLKAVPEQRCFKPFRAMQKPL